MKRICLLVVIILIMGNWVKSQPNLDTYTNVIPPSPTASSLGTYGQVPVGMFTGTAQFNIPIYEVKSRKISIPISLDYGTNGVKVDQVASWVGMGWSLNAGGVITRTVKDRADEISNRISFEEIETIEDLDPKVLEDIIMDPDNENVDTEPDIYAYNFNGISGKFIIDLDGFPRQIPYNGVEIEVKGGINRTFVITTTNGIKYYFGQNSSGGLESAAVEQTTSQSSCAEGREGQDTFYTAWYLTKIEHPVGDKIEFSYLSHSSNYESGAYQVYTKAKQDPTCSDCDNMGYSDECATELIISSKRLSEINTDNVKVQFVSSYRSDFDGYRLDAINIKDAVTNTTKKSYNLGYIYSTNTTHTNRLSGTSSSRLFLDSFVEKNLVTSEEKAHTFEYNDIDNLPVRLSYSQDHWGYYNGKNNGDKFLHINTSLNYIFGSSLTANREPNSQTSKYGTLKKISYPTGGTSEIDYEQHQYLGEVHEYQPSDMEYYSESIVGLLNEHEDTFNETVNIQYGQEYITFTATLECITTNGSTSDNGEGSVHVNLGSKTVFSFSPAFDESTDITAGQKLTLTKKVFAGDIGLPSSGFKGNFNIALEAVDEEFEMKLSFSYVKSPPSETLVEKNIDTGGVRVKRITTKESDDSEEQIVRYFYGDLDDINKSSATKPVIPVYFNFSQVQIACPSEINRTDCDLFTLSSNSNNALYGVGGSHIAYASVIKSYGENFENGGEYFQYIANVDQRGRVKVGGEVIAGSSYSNTGWNSGKVKEHGTFSINSTGEYVMLKKDNYIYNFEHENSTSNDTRFSDKLTAAVIRKVYSISYLPGELSPGRSYTECDASNVNLKYSGGWFCSTDHKHSWALGPWDGWRCIKIFGSPSNNDEIFIYHPCYGKDPDANPPITIQYWNHIGDYTVNLYDVLTRWSYLIQKTTTIYDENGQNPHSTTTTYEYGNNDSYHTNQTKSIFYGSNGDQHVTKQYYPYDYDLDHATGLIPMLENDITDVPIDIRQEVNGYLTSGQLFDYNEFGQPKEIYQAKNELGNSLSFDDQSPYSYGDLEVSLSYDTSTGNLQEFQKTANIPSVLLWGYNKTLSVAKIENASIEQISSTVVSNIEGYDFTNSSVISDIQSDVQYLKTQLSTYIDDPRFMVTLYTYDPLIGMTSQTDPAGITTYYEYDGFGRLESIKDEGGNIVKAYDYHYIPEPELSVSTEGLSFPSTGSNNTVNITSDVAWTRSISYDDSGNTGWINTSPTSGSGNSTMTISASTNSSTSSRSGTVTISDNSGSGLQDQVISIDQQGVSLYLNISPNTMDFTDTDSEYFDISSNISWDIDIFYYDDQDWINDIYPDEGTGNRNNLEVEITDLPPYGETWEAEIEIYGNGIEKTIFVTVTN